MTWFDPVPKLVAGSGGVEPALHRRRDLGGIRSQKLKDCVVVGPVQPGPDARQVFRRNRELVLVLLPAVRRPQVLSADDERALCVELGPDAVTIVVVQSDRAGIQSVR